MNEVKIRTATLGDEAEIANVHLNSWREAYRDLLAPEYLDSLPLTFKSRMLSWRSTLAKAPSFMTFVAESREGVVGFALFGPARDADRAPGIELGAIYLLEKYKGKGVGKRLMQKGFEHIKAQGFDKTYCWVLEGNPTIKFYEATGATFAGNTKDDTIGGRAVKELLYEWKTLGEI